MRVTKPPFCDALAIHHLHMQSARLWSLAYSHILMKSHMQMRTTFSFWPFLFFLAL